MFALNVLQNGPWSISKANCLNMCPKQYNYKYITKTPEVSKSAESQFGVFLHQIIETILKNPKIEAETLIEESDLNIDQKIDRKEKMLEGLVEIPALTDGHCSKSIPVICSIHG